MGNTKEQEEEERRFPLFSMVKKNGDVKVYIESQNEVLNALGYTEHGRQPWAPVPPDH
ncbi:MAG: hypothetical protein PUC46_07335 [Lachnospiraceae bacterium]|nr:hypothetical protein [Lachnospiraceae bacterium]